MSDETVKSAEATEVKAPKVAEFSIEALLEDLKNGIDRKAQAEKYGVPLAVLNRAYLSTPLLKGKKVHKEREKRPGSRTMGFVFTDAAKFANATAPATSVAPESVEAESQTAEAPSVEQTQAAPVQNPTAGW